MGVGHGHTAAIVDIGGGDRRWAEVGALPRHRCPEVVHHHARAPRCEQQGVLPAKSSSSTGHNGNLAVET